MEDQHFYYALAVGVAIILYYIVSRWAHDIPKRNRYLQAQIKLLAKIAKEQGVPDSDIRKILNEAGRTEDAV